MIAPDARPSSIGEILDRAIATYVRRWIPLFVILAAFAVPVAFLEYFTQPGFNHVIDTLNRLLTLPPADTEGRARILRDFNQAAAPGAWVAFYYLLELLVYPLARTAFVVYAARTIDGVPVTIAAAYREALQRWVPQIFVGLAFLGIAMMLGIAFFVSGALATLAVVAVGLVSRLAGMFAGSVLALALIAATVVVVAFAYTAWLMAGISVAIEDGNPVRAIGRSLRRTLDPALRRRTLGVALAVVALDWFGALAIVSFAGLVVYAGHALIVYALIAAAAGTLLDGLCTIFVLLYMRDVAMRREGADLLLLSAENNRPGDYGPGSIVLHDDGLDGSDRALIAQFLARRAALEPQAAAEVAARIAERVRPKLRASFHYLDDVALLEHLARSR